MDNQLKNFIKKELQLNELSDSKQFCKVRDKIEELKKVTKELEIYFDEEESALLKPVKEIERTIKEDSSLPNPVPAEPANYERGDYDIYVPFKISGIEFHCTLSFLMDAKKYISGVYFEGKKEDEIYKFLQTVFQDKIKETKDDAEWYGYKKIDEANEARVHFIELVHAVKAEKEKWDNQNS